MIFFSSGYLFWQRVRRNSRTMLSMWYSKKTVLMMMNFGAGIVLAWLIFPCSFFPILGRVLFSAGLSARPPCKEKEKNETCLLVHASVPASVSAEAAAASSTSAGGELAREETMVFELVPRDWWVESFQC